MRWMLCFLFLCSVAHADSLIYQGINYIEDAKINSASANTNYGTGTQISVYALATASRSLLIRAYGVAEMLTSSDYVDSVRLGLYASAFTSCNSQPEKIAFYRVLKPFAEAYMTWNDWYTTDSEWTTAGCQNAADSVDNRGDGARPDRWATAFDTLIISTTGWQYLDITDLFNNWRTGTYAENGILGKPISFPCFDYAETRDSVNFWSTNYTTDTTLRPRLAIYYHVVEASAEVPRYRQGPRGCDVRTSPSGASRRTGP